jgi:hypothetical protein
LDVYEVTPVAMKFIPIELILSLPDDDDTEIPDVDVSDAVDEDVMLISDDDDDEDVMTTPLSPGVVDCENMTKLFVDEIAIGDDDDDDSEMLPPVDVTTTFDDETPVDDSDTPVALTDAVDDDDFNSRLPVVTPTDAPVDDDSNTLPAVDDTDTGPFDDDST